MYLSIEAVVNKGKLDLKEPVSLPDGTKAIVTFIPESNMLAIQKKEWFASLFEKTKNTILDEQFEDQVNEAQSLLNAWKPAQ